jgi:putative phosphoesterase
VRVAVISDTHFPQRGPGLPPPCTERLASADLIVHAGDLCDLRALGSLRDIGPPVIAVHGNVDDADVRAQLPRETEFDVDGVRVAVVHDAGLAAGRLSRLRRQFPAAGVVIFGHSHVPLIEQGADGFLILNPGSPTDRRRQAVHTMAELIVEPGYALRATIIPLDDTAGIPRQND